MRVQFGATGGNAKLRWGRGWGVVGRVVGSLFFFADLQICLRIMCGTCARAQFCGNRDATPDLNYVAKFAEAFHYLRGQFGATEGSAKLRCGRVWGVVGGVVGSLFHGMSVRFCSCIMCGTCA